MDCNLSPHKNTADLDFFGLKSRFLVYGQPQKGQPEPKAEGIDENPAKKTTELIRQHNQREQQEARLNREISQLEHEAAKQVSEFNSAKKRKKFSKPPLALIALNSGRVDANKSLQRVEQYEQEKLTKKQRKALAELNPVLEKLQKAHLNNLQHKAEKAYPTAEYQDVMELNEFFDDFKKIGRLAEKKNYLKNQPHYNEIQKDFDMATKNWVLKGNQEPWAAENEQWFFALLAVETHEFRDDFVLSDPTKFTENHEENRKRFPFLYKAWLEMNGVDMQSLKMHENAVDRQQTFVNQLIATGEIPSLEQIDQQFADVLPERDFKLNDPKDWGKQETYLYKAIKTLRDNGQAEIATAVRHHAKLAGLIAISQRAVKNNEQKVVRFTYSELAQPKNRQQRVELAMLKFKKAQEIVDAPFKQSQWNHLHPTVRGLMIANIYESGVAQATENATELKQAHPEHYWMLTQVTKSRALNGDRKGKKLDLSQKKALAYAMVGSQAMSQKKAHEQFIARLEVQMQQPGANVQRLNTLKHERQIQIEICNAYLQLAEQAIANPWGNAADELERKIQAGEFSSIIDAQSLRMKMNFQAKVELGYRAMDFEANRQSAVLEAVGINSDAFHAVYVDRVAKDPQLRVENWNTLLHSPNRAQFEKIYNLFALGLSDNMAGGKERFLAGLRVINRRYQENGLKHLSDEESVVIQIVENLAAHVRHGETIAGYRDTQKAEIEAALNGELLADKFNNAIEGVVQGLMDPHDHVQFASSAIIVAAAVGIGMKLWQSRNSDSNWARAGKFAVVVAAASVVAERTTGRGISSLTGLNTIAKKIEGTQESVLLEKGAEHMASKEITREQHAQAIYQLNDVPFHELMRWYKNSDINGMPRAGQSDLFPAGMNVGAVYRPGPFESHDSQTIERKRRYILKQTLGQFFAYVGNKKGGGHNTEVQTKRGEDILNDRWVRMVRNPDANLVRADSASAYMAQKYHDRPGELTFARVSEMEVDLFDIEQTVGKNGLDPAFDWLMLTGQGFMEWNREKVGKIQGYSEQFMVGKGRQLTEGAKERVKAGAKQLTEFLVKVGEAGGKQLKAVGNEISFFFEGHKYQLRRFGRGFVEIFMEGGGLAVDAVVVPVEKLGGWSIETLRGLRQVVRPKKLSFLKGKELSLEDIYESSEAMKSYDLNKNPAFQYLGLYQPAYYEAFRNRENNIEEPAFFETPKNNTEYRDEQVGYCITQISASELGLENVSRNERLARMKTESYERAKETFINQMGKEGKEYQVTAEDIEKFMSQIHVMTSQDGETMVVFWRMSGGDELAKKRNNTWAASYNDARYKFTPPFEVNERQDVLEQLAELANMQIEHPIGIWKDAGKKLVGKTFTFALRNIEMGAEASVWGMDKLMRKDQQLALSKYLKGVLENADQFKTHVAEFTGDLNYSPYYKDRPLRQDIYHMCLAHARHPHHPHRLDLSIFEREKGYPGKRYVGTPSKQFSYESLNRFYKEVWMGELGHPRNNLFENLLEPKLKKERSEKTD